MRMDVDMDGEDGEEGDEMDIEIERMRMMPGGTGGEVELDVEGNEDVARFCGVGCVQRTIKGLCETQGESFFEHRLVYSKS
jgi:hypothetical protein